MKALIDMMGEVFGRLTVEYRSRKTSKGEWYWLCHCQCGEHTEVKRANLISGSVKSCGCLAAELTSERGRSRKLPSVICEVEGCTKEAREYGRTLCRKHGKRMRVYGDVNYVTPETERASRQRSSILRRFESVKPTTYRKFHGRHEHRVIGENISGRKLRSDEHVHHIDGNKHNNDPSNLMVLSAEDHARLHAMEKIHG